jgi:hypothetical protein
MAVSKETVFWDVTDVWQMFTHVSEECSASIFMVEDGCSALL